MNNSKALQYQKIPWYFSTGTIMIVSFFGILIVPIVLAVIMSISQQRIKKNNALFIEKNFGPGTDFENHEKIKALLVNKENSLNQIESQIANKHNIFKEYEDASKVKIEEDIKKMISDAEITAESIVNNSASEVKDVLENIENYKIEINSLQKQQSDAEKMLNKTVNQGKKFKVEAQGVKNFIGRFQESINLEQVELKLHDLMVSYEPGSLLHNLVDLDCHYKDSKSLRKEMNRNKKELNQLLESYLSRYTTKSNKAIYQLMVIGLQAELQNVLYTLTYSKLEEAVENIKSLIQKYLVICAQGNTSILPTVTRFLSEVEPLFIEAITIEYHYHIQKEKEKEEQRAIREQMKQDAAERKALEEERKKIEAEEAKFMVEMDRNRDLLLNETDIEKVAALEARIKELEGQYSELEVQKEEIIKRANGRAGYVYVISNLGAFGDKMYKIGMTRRLNPLDRVDELGDASVPFKFDVHAMIFSNNAVELEQKIHQTLHKQRVNLINLRKEFFVTDILHLRHVVEDIDPTVEFKTTLIAQEYHQSLALRSEENKDELLQIS